jgi:hypothetical protein
VDDAKVEKIRQLGLYFGPIILGSGVANGLYQVVCNDSIGATFTVGTQPSLLTVPLLIGFTFLAWRFESQSVASVLRSSPFSTWCSATR